MDYTVKGILQARILEWVDFPFSRGSSQPRDWTRSPKLQADYLPAAPQGKLKNTGVGSLSLLQQIVPKQKLNNGLLHCRQILYQLSYKASLLLVWKAMTNLDSLLKRRDITLLTIIHLVKAMVSPVVMYGCQSWIIKKAELDYKERIDAFELWYWRRLLRVTWTARRSNQSILKEISPEYSLEGLMLKLKLQYFGYLMWRTD